MLTQWVGASVAEIGALPNYRNRLLEKTGTAMTADGSGNDRITLEGLEEAYTFMDVESDGGNEESSEGDGSEETGQGGEDNGGGGSRDEGEEDNGHDIINTEDLLSIIEHDDDDEVTDGEEIVGMTRIPDGFQL